MSSVASVLPPGTTKQDEGNPVAYRLLREALSTRSLSKEFITLCKYVKEKKEDATNTHAQTVFKELSTLELHARRHLLADQANAHDQKLHEVKQAQLDHEIEQASQALESHKAHLQTARADKKRKLQYEERRHRCIQYPKRSKTAADIDAVHQEIEALQTETDQAVQQYEVHGKRFAVLTRFVDELEASLNPDEVNAGERSRADGLTDQSDRDQSDRDSAARSMQE